jgi:preprotein translocase subunit SecG
VTIFITIVHVAVCLALIAIVLLQQGKGADIGAAFGGGASQTVFGGRGAGSFLSKLTTGAAIVFMITSLTLSYFATPTSVEDFFEEEGLEETTLEEIPIPVEPGCVGWPLPDRRQRVEAGAESDVPSGFEAIEPPTTGEPEPAPTQ